MRGAGGPFRREAMNVAPQWDGTSSPPASPRRGAGFLDAELDRHWSYFTARVYEIRMFVHQPEQGQPAVARAVAAWRAFQTILAHQVTPVTPEQSRTLAEIDGLVRTLESQL